MSDIEKMKKEIAEWKADRVARGLPPSPPEPFVPVALATVLVEQCTPLYEYLAKYTQLCNKADAILPANVEIFNRYADYLTLISCTGQPVDAFYAGMLIAKKQIEKAESYTTAGQYVRRLLQALGIAKFGYKIPLYQSAYNYKLGNHENNELRDKAHREYERLKADEAVLAAEVERYLAQYKTIKHLY
jgi:hypothetical protein